ncbi:enoyl-CoA hydratase-related protein [Nocardioides sp.]|uniref:enoyl-CoA hydratase-related protein n=1 Tax=Nocardioides sp. TaxID=35761 RepID=UPI003D0CB4B9
MTEGSVATEVDTVLADRRGGVLVLTLNRPDRLNAWNSAMESRYFSLLDEAERDGDVRAIVVTGAGRGFCAGADMDDLQVVAGADEQTLPVRQVPCHRPLLLAKPLIAAVNGAAAGLGFVQAMYADMRFTSPDVKFTTAFARRGLIAEYGIAWLLPRLVGQSAASDLLLSGRIVKGHEALEMGLVDRVVEPDQLLEETVAYAQELAAFSSPAAMKAIKAQLLQAQQSSFLEAVADADARMLESFQHPDLAEGVSSHLERRGPRFAGLAGS